MFGVSLLGVSNVSVCDHGQFITMTKTGLWWLGTRRNPKGLILDAFPCSDFILLHCHKNGRAGSSPWRLGFCYWSAPRCSLIGNVYWKHHRSLGFFMSYEPIYAACSAHSCTTLILEWCHCSFSNRAEKSPQAPECRSTFRAAAQWFLQVNKVVPGKYKCRIWWGNLTS